MAPNLPPAVPVCCLCLFGIGNNFLDRNIGLLGTRAPLLRRGILAGAVSERVFKVFFVNRRQKKFPATVQSSRGVEWRKRPSGTMKPGLIPSRLPRWYGKAYQSAGAVDARP